jgi:ProP effector
MFMSSRDDAVAVIELLCERYPRCFFLYEGRRRPLKIGIHKDIPEGLFEPSTLSLAHRLYVGNDGYLRSMRAGAARIDLDGNAVGVVSDGEASGAMSLLIVRAKREREKKAAQRKQEQAAKKTPPAPPPPPPPPKRDSMSALREAARKRRGAG